MSDEERTPTGPPRAPRERLWPAIAIPLGLLLGIGIVLFAFSRVLLHVEPHVATATALLVAVAIVTLLAIIASRKRVTNGSVLMMVTGVIGIAMVLSGAALVVGQGTEEGGTEAVTVAIAAPTGAAASGFDEKTLSAPSDTPFTIAFDNQDPGVQHNIVIASADPAKDSAAQTLFTGDLVTGPSAFDYEISPLPEATYYFYCEIHPTTMNGQLNVSPGAEPGSNTGGETIQASGLAFDTDTLTFPANTPTTLTFQNEDAGTPHNVAIYTDESASNSLFVGEIVTGVITTEYQIPALKSGSYYFHCDVHPNMHGTVTVGTKTGGGGSGGGGSGSTPPPTPSASASAAPPPSSEPPSGGSASLTAQGLAFTPTSLSLPPGAGSTVTFDNEDAGVPHDFAIFSDDSYTNALFTGETVTGVNTITYDIPALDPGTYPFRCNIHPTMTGTLTVG